MVSLQSLPVELLDAICHHLQRPDLVALSRSNSTLHSVAQRLLYRHISVGNSLRNVGLIITLANKPHLARYVRSFSIRLNPSFTLLQSFYKRLADALTQMTELVSLEVFVDSALSWVLPTKLGTTFPRLLYFSCSFPLDSHVIHFLGKTNALLQLEVDSLSTPQLLTVPDVPNTSIPRLSAFTGSLHAAQAIVPGRPVEVIHLNSGDLTEDVAEMLAKSTVAVFVLAATTSSLPLPLLGSLAQSMPDLQFLRLMTTYNFWDLFAGTFCQNITSALTLMKSLKTFELSGMLWGISQKPLEDERRAWESDPHSTPFVQTLESEAVNADLESDLAFVY